MWNFGRPNKQTGPPTKKVMEVPNIRTLELTGDLIGHSGAVQVAFFSIMSKPTCFTCFNDPFLCFRQMFVSFEENGLVTCSTDHLLILWKNGERQSQLRSLALFQKLEENGGLWPLTPELLPLKMWSCRVMLASDHWLYCDDYCLLLMIMWWLLLLFALWLKVFKLN